MKNIYFSLNTSSSIVGYVSNKYVIRYVFLSTNKQNMIQCAGQSKTESIFAEILSADTRTFMNISFSAHKNVEIHIQMESS